LPEFVAITDDAGEPGEESAAHACDQRLGRYRLCFEVAHGGMATVYLARADGPGGFGKLVALKRIHPHLARERAFVDMFLDEARIASLLSHPNVCGVTDFGQADDTYYLTMEYLVGESLGQVHHKLAQRQRLGPIDDHVPIACRILADACEGLHSAHELKGPLGKPLQLVHRDVSPHNLFVTFEGAVKVVDFGIASAADRLHHTKAGAVKGKFPYMAPEVLEGKGIDRRADVWALGVVLWETIALKRLFRRSTDSETLVAVMQKPIPRLSEVRPNVPAELDRIVERALTRRPEDRYASARELGQDLTRFLGTRRESVSMLEVAQFMHGLFPDGFAKKQQLLEIARQLEDGVIPSVAGNDNSTGTLTFKSVSASMSRVMHSRRRVLPLVAFVTVFMLLALGAALWSDARGAAERGRAASGPAAEPLPTPAQAAPFDYTRRDVTPAARAPAAVQAAPVLGDPAFSPSPPAAAAPRSRVRAGSSTRAAGRARVERIYRRD
jgi:eukaryotic-like serine/threonine-protein kinase